MSIVQTRLLGTADEAGDRGSAKRLQKISLLACFEDRNIESKR
jgi:hypothetical protein